MSLPRQRLIPLSILVIGAIALALYAYFSFQKSQDLNQTTQCVVEPSVVEIPGGEFTMGSNNTYEEEAWATPKRVDTFWIDTTEVTVEQFSRFVTETGYISEAEKKHALDLSVAKTPEEEKALKDMSEPGGVVFFSELGQIAQNLSWWRWVVGANWRLPEGPNKPASKASHPVTQLTYQDALHYAEWAGGRLPTEAEWEYAALAGKKNIDFGPDHPTQANSWQGAFPAFNTADDGFEGVAPVGCFAPNDFGLYDMIGNVWEWTADVYTPKHSGEAFDTDNQNHTSSPEQIHAAATASQSKVIKGGSYLCAENYCRRFRPAARQPQEADLSTNHVGFRVVYDSPENVRKDN